MGTNTGHAVYDVTLKRYVSGIYPSAAKAKKGPEFTGAPSGHDVEVRAIGAEAPEPESDTPPEA